jgi:glutamate synthase domain-containing protein 3
VFALQEGQVKIGLIASERQAIDACLRSLATVDSRFAAKADLYWNARGGSYTDGGAFVFTVDRTSETAQLKCFDKFGCQVSAPPKADPQRVIDGIRSLGSLIPSLPTQIVTEASSIEDLCLGIETQAGNHTMSRETAVECLISLLDRLHLLPFAEGRSRAKIESSLFSILRSYAPISPLQTKNWVLIDFAKRGLLRPPGEAEDTLLLDVSDFPAEGGDSASALIVQAYRKGWKRVLSFDWRGQRFCGAGLGPHSENFRIDCFGNPGDYLASGLDGAEIYVHGSAQDQVAQIMKSGKLVIYGDVGQTFMYAAKGGEVYMLGNAAGRPLINAVGRPRVVINGTCLDYLAESFMAGDPLQGGGFAVVNGIRMGEDGDIRELETPYPGSNLFSLASGGAIYLRDPFHRVGSDQLNGGNLTGLDDSDWQLILPYLKENERLFGATIEELLRVGKDEAEPSGVYRKVEAVRLKALAAGE